MVGITTWFTLGAVGMALGTLGLAAGLRFVDPAVRRRYAILVAVPGIAVVAYVLMALDVGRLVGGGGTVVFLPRYVDWLLTTPLHVLYLGLLSRADRDVVARAAGLQGATIILGLAGALTTGLVAWALFALGSLAFVGVIYSLYGECARSARERCPDDVTALYEKLRSFVILLWLVYPLIWVLSTAGVGVMQPATTTLVVAYIDVVAKVGFGLIALNGQLTIVGDAAGSERGAGAAA